MAKDYRWRKRRGIVEAVRVDEPVRGGAVR